MNNLDLRKKHIFLKYNWKLVWGGFEADGDDLRRINPRFFKLRKKSKFIGQKVLNFVKDEIFYFLENMSYKTMCYEAD